jgi:NADH-quinone oxidoreductase subunit K
MTALAASLLAIASGLGAPGIPGVAQAPAAVVPGGVGLAHYLVTSALVFGLGLMVIITRRNAIAILMGIELLLNAAGLNFVAFAKFSSPDPVSGQIVTIFVIVIAAAEASLALAIVLNLFNNINTVEVTEARSLKG